MTFRGTVMAIMCWWVCCWETIRSLTYCMSKRLRYGHSSCIMANMSRSCQIFSVVWYWYQYFRHPECSTYNIWSLKLLSSRGPIMNPTLLPVAESSHGNKADVTLKAWFRKVEQLKRGSVLVDLFAVQPVHSLNHVWLRNSNKMTLLCQINFY